MWDINLVSVIYVANIFSPSFTFFMVGFCLPLNRFLFFNVGKRTNPFPLAPGLGSLGSLGSTDAAENSRVSSGRAWARPARSRSRSRSRLHLAHTCVWDGARWRAGPKNVVGQAAGGGPRLRTDKRAEPAGSLRGGARVRWR